MSSPVECADYTLQYRGRSARLGCAGLAVECLALCLVVGRLGTGLGSSPGPLATRLPSVPSSPARRLACPAHGRSRRSARNEGHHNGTRAPLGPPKGRCRRRGVGWRWRGARPGPVVRAQAQCFLPPPPRARGARATMRARKVCLRCRRHEGSVSKNPRLEEGGDEGKLGSGIQRPVGV